MTRTDAELILHGLPAGGGVAVGRLRVAAPGGAARPCADGEEDFAAATARARAELEKLIAGEGELAGEILEFQQALLEDEDFLAPVRARIAEGVPWREAWDEMVDAEIAAYRAGGDDYLAARADDLVDLKQRVRGAAADIAGAEAGEILATGELTPSQFLRIGAAELAGIVLTGGSPSGHVAILARDRGINLIVGLKADLSALPDGKEAIIDAARGLLIVSPGEARLREARRGISRLADEEKAAATLLEAPARTADGERVQVMLNIAEPETLEKLSADICDGVGLTRTEFLFSGGALPDEETQFGVYRRIMEWAKGKPVTIRTLDAGGDKPIPGVTPEGEANPFLGVRGLRLSLRRPEMFRAQLRALLRAARLGELKVMLPMVSTPSEMTRARAHLAAAREELRARGEAFGEISLGMMVEVPAAALTAEDFDADFYSIGSNDLIQYAFAAARDNPEVSDLWRDAEKAIMTLIRRTVEAGGKTGREVSLCGAMASDPEMTGRLLETGLRVLSVAPAMTGRVKLAVSRHAAGEPRSGNDG